MMNNYRKLHGMPMRRRVHLRHLYFKYEWERDIEKAMQLIDKFCNDGIMTIDDVRTFVRGEFR